MKCSYQTYDGNFITSQLIIKMSWTVVSLRRIFFTQNLIANQVNVFFSADTSWCRGHLRVC